jgi:DNA glycosylase AlkZ-like
VLADRLSAQGLTGLGGRTPEEAVGRLLAVQAQDPRGARLSIRARTAGLSARDVDAGLSDRRALLITWLNRGTLHLVQAEDYWWLRPLVTPQMATGVARRLAQEGVSPAQAERGLDVIAEQVSTLGPRTRSELRTALDEAGVPTVGQALVHVLATASIRGDLVRGPMRGADHCFVSAEAWLGARPEPLERPAALARLAHRYLTGHGPADAHDLAKWAGITIGDARAALAGTADKLVKHAGGLVDLADRRPTPPLPPPRLLGPFDPLLHGWASRVFIVGRHQGIVTSNGLFRPFALVEGRAVATWGLARGQVTIRPLERINRAHLQALKTDAVEVLRFLHLPPSSAIVQR